MNKITINGFEESINEKDVPAAVKTSEYGCRNCLWAFCECQNGSKYVPKGADGCAGYTYYD